MVALVSSRLLERARTVATASTFWSVIRVFAGFYGAATFAFYAAGNQDLVNRGILSNALSDGEQKRLTVLVVLGLALAAGWVVVTVRRDALEAWSYAPFLLAPLGLWPTYEAYVEPFVRLVVVAAMAALSGVALLGFAERSPQRRVLDLGDHPAFVRAAPWVALAAGILHAVLMGRVAQRLVEELFVGWDVSIYTQVHWNISTTFVPWSTTYTDATFNHYAIHFSPIYHLTSLVYAFHRSPVTLVWVQAMAVGLGALPAYLLATRVTRSALAGLLTAFAYLLNPCAQGFSLYEFHEIVFFVPLMLTLAWAVEAERVGRWVWALVALLLMVREDVPAYLVVYGIWLVVSGRAAFGKKLVVVAGVYLVIVHGAVMPALRAGAPYVFDDRYSGLVRPGQVGKASIVSTIVTNVPYVLSYVFGVRDKWEFVTLLLLSVGFAPLASGRASILLVPGLAFSLLSSFSAQYAIVFHYTAPIMPFLYVTALVGAKRLGGERRAVPLAFVVAGLVATCLLAGKLRSPVLNPGFVERELAARDVYGAAAPAIRAAAASIPKDQTCVRATANLLPAVVERRRAYIIPNGKTCEWALIDYRRDGRHPPSTYAQEHAWLLEAVRSGEYGIRYLDDKVVLLGKGEPKERNAELVERLEAVPP